MMWYRKSDWLRFSYIIQLILIYCIYLFGIGSIECSIDLKGFDDTILFKINWPNSIDETILPKVKDDEHLEVVTTNIEKYKCYIPDLEKKKSESDAPYSGPMPTDIILTFFAQNVCSYKIESYWTYELCHGKYVKQYHEERDGKTTKLQEFFLGKWDKLRSERLRSNELGGPPPPPAKSIDGGGNGNHGEPLISNKPLKYKRIEGLNLPYVEIEMADGTVCDINNEPRIARVLYVCYEHGKNEIYSLKETYTCNYEVIVLTPILCSHPSYRPQETTENSINCFPNHVTTPDKPLNLIAMELENMKMKFGNVANNKDENNRFAVFKLDPKDGTMKMELIPAEIVDVLLGGRTMRNTGNILAAAANANAFAMNADGDENDADADDTTASNIMQTDKTSQKSQKPTLSFEEFRKSTANQEMLIPIQSFFRGKECLYAGTGWWKYEICYGVYVRQFHTDKNGEQTSILLGSFIDELHKEWLVKNPQKRPTASGTRKSITHLYAGGTLCEKTGEKRETEVRFKCLTNSPSISTISMYLLEPQTCKYVFSIESPVICDLIQLADDDGLLHDDNYERFGAKRRRNVIDFEIRREND